MSTSDLEVALRRRVRGDVRFDPYSRVFYSTDASSYQIEPVGVVIPRTLQDVHAAVETALDYGVPILARGGGTSLAGQAVGHALIIDFSRHLDRILEINPEEGWVRVEPGVVCDQLNAALKPHGLLFGTDPASANRATLGGMINNNSTGAHSVLYGMTADHLLSADVILADKSTTTFSNLAPAELEYKKKLDNLEGQLYRSVHDLVLRNEALIREKYPRTWRRASGYSLNYLLDFAPSQPAGWYLDPAPYPPQTGFNLGRLLAGSEGTLAVLTGAKLRLAPRPKMTALDILHFGSVEAAAAAAPAILECRPSAVELVDRSMLDLTRNVPAYARMLTFVQGQPEAILIVEFYGESLPELNTKLDNLETHLRHAGAADTFVRAVTREEQANVWGVRKVGLGLLMSVKGDAKPLAFMEDVAVPVERLAEYVHQVQEIFEEFQVSSGYYAHASAGCLHIRPLISLKTAVGIARMRAIAEAVLEVVVSMGGAMSGEHGDGLSRSEWNARLYGPELYQAFRQVKALFDPRGLLNPGKVVDPPKMDKNLRYGPEYHTLPLSTVLDFSADGGFAQAVELCNGAGVCRKDGGVMCPSFQATREEEHSTRGRANALRAAVSGVLPPAALTEPRLHAVLDLCLECKACKAECPSGVDMAKIKYEFLHQYQQVHGVPLRSRFFADINRVSRIAQRISPVVNFVLRLRPVRWLNEKLLGISRHRILPPYARRSFHDWYRTYRIAYFARGAIRGARARRVVLFVDTFTNYNHPEAGIAAVKVLDAAGFEVLTVPHACCGRPMISKGLLEQARELARRNVAQLALFAEQGIPVVGLEPSCLLTLRDEYLDLLPGDSQAAAVAGAAKMIEEFIAELSESGELELEFGEKRTEREVLFHGHCYQKALTGTAPLKKMLSLTGREIREIDSGCCGMAGSFGYETEHYGLSQQIGEMSLFPSVREGVGRGAEIAAAGISCRHQIQGATGVLPKHPIELLAEALH